jgi:hypothetical protein
MLGLLGTPAVTIETTMSAAMASPMKTKNRMATSFTHGRVCASSVDSPVVPFVTHDHQGLALDASKYGRPPPMGASVVRRRVVGSRLSRPQALAELHKLAAQGLDGPLLFEDHLGELGDLPLEMRVPGFDVDQPRFHGGTLARCNS